MEVKVTQYNTQDSILYNLHEYVGKSIEVVNTNVPANSEGRKIVKAGSLVSKAGVAYVEVEPEVEGEDPTIEPLNDGNARYVLLHDVDVTAGPKSVTGIYVGTIYARKLPFEYSAEAKAALKGIFVMGDDSDY